MMNMVELGTIISPAKVRRCGTDEYSVLSMTMHDGLVFQNDKFKKAIASKDRSNYKVVLRNQLVISFPIDEGVLATQRITDAGIVSPAYGIWEINQEKMYPEFLEHALRCNRAIEYYKAKLRGSTARRRSLPTPTLLAFTIPMPSLDEQAAILEVVHKAKRLITAREQQLAALDTLIKARFVEMFGDPITNSKGWKTEKLSAVCSAIYGGGTPSKSHPEYFEGDIPWVSPKDMKSMVILDSIDHITSEAVDNSSAKMVPAGAVLMVIRSGILKHTLPVALAAVDVTVNQDMKVFITGDKISSEFLMFYFKAIERDVLSGVRGVTADNIDFKEFQNRMIIVPPIGVQEQFSNFVKQVDKSKVVVQEQIDKLQMLFDSLMQQYFG